MSDILIQKPSKVDLTDIQKENLKEKIFKICAMLILIIFPFTLVMCFRVVKQYKRAIIFRFGKVRADSPAGPGVIWVLPCTDNILFVDLRTQSLNLPPQEILTKDSVTITVDAVVYFHVLNPLECVLNVQSHMFSSEMIAIATLRNILGQYTLTDVLNNREIISRVARYEIGKVTAEWGVEMERVEIKDVILPFELQKAMAAEAEGTRTAKAKIIEAESEIKAAENLKQASRIMIENPQIMLLRNFLVKKLCKSTSYHEMKTEPLKISQHLQTIRTTDPTDNIISEIVSETIKNKSTHRTAARTNNQVPGTEGDPVTNGPARPLGTQAGCTDSQLENENEHYESRTAKTVYTQTSHINRQLPMNENYSFRNNETKPTNSSAQTNTQVQEDEIEPVGNRIARSGDNNTTDAAIETQPKHEMFVENQEESRIKETLKLNSNSNPEKGLPVPQSSILSFQHSRLQTKYAGGDKCIEKILVFMSYLLVIVFFPFSLFCVFVAVRHYERVVILRNGKVYKNTPFGPGLIHTLPCVDVVKFIELRIICHAVPPQEALTKNSLTVSVDAVVYYKICDPVWAVINVTNYRMSTQLLAATTLRNAIGTKRLQELLTDRPAVSYLVFQNMKHYAREWGIKIVRVEIKDICLPVQLQGAMAAEAASSRLANAKIIVAKSEIESTRNLQKATTLLMDNPFCMQLRYLQSLQTIAGDKTHTIVFPFSTDIIKKLLK